MPFILGSNSVSGYTVKNSLRFDRASSDYLSRTPSSTSNRRTYTISFWFKLSEISTSNYIRLFSSTIDTNNRIECYFNPTTHNLYFETGTSATFSTLTTSQSFRDISAWYHLVIAVDTTQATSSNRMRLYLNGSEITSFSSSSYPSQNNDTPYNVNTASLRIGGANLYGINFSGYMSEIYSIDGSQLTPSSFGQTDTDTGIWIPKAYTGTYGTNGFYLKFANSASLGTDSSGNGNTFTVNNLTSIDQTTDTPTNNFATLNPLAVFNTTSPAYSEGNLKATWSSGGNSYTNGTFLLSKGKWYFEVKGSTNDCAIFARDPSNYTDFGGTYGFSNANGNKITNGSSSASQSAGASNDILQMALDMDNNKLWVGRNGTYFASGDPSAGTNAFISSLPTDLVPSFQNYGNNIQANFGSPIYSANSYTDGAGRGNFSYAVPSGYFALCTANLSLYG